MMVITLMMKMLEMLEQLEDLKDWDDQEALGTHPILLMGAVDCDACAHDGGRCFFHHKLMDLLHQQYGHGMYVVEYQTEH